MFKFRCENCVCEGGIAGYGDEKYTIRGSIGLTVPSLSRDSSNVNISAGKHCFQAFIVVRF